MIGSKYKVLEKLLLHPDISPREINLLFQTLIFINGGIKTTDELLDAFEKMDNEYIEYINEFVIKREYRLKEDDHSYKVQL